MSTLKVTTEIRLAELHDLKREEEWKSDWNARSAKAAKCAKSKARGEIQAEIAEFLKGKIAELESPKPPRLTPARKVEREPGK